MQSGSSESLERVTKASVKLAVTRLNPDLIRTVIFDADGVLIHGKTAHPGAAELLDWVRASGRRIYVLTNNSSTARSRYATRLRRIGFRVDASEIITSG